MTTHVIMNGDPVTLHESVTVRDAVARLLTRSDGTYSDRGVAVAVNQAVVPRSDWSSITLGSGDTVEIITAVQGG
ncbi:sulfur carrier protein ThiS [Haloactinopolyspora sp.]|uniref:sulfur carrier protein ThiS n=1 Tax=Haloactinopolyspora sp. TaxID=1966353 RepID=UPI00260D1BB4|nr:sulfur carrier protein ThiS [Haloactinopolyspora sp.]